jgi:hydrogenase nickel incorporation protein HypA/HybF
LIDQVTELARQNDAVAVARIEVEVGVLSGVEALLLESAFTLSKPGTVAETAELATTVTPPRIACRACGAEAETPANDLSCPACDSLETDLVRGHELILARVELIRAD